MKTKVSKRSKIIRTIHNAPGISDMRNDIARKRYGDFIASVSLAVISISCITSGVVALIWVIVSIVEWFLDVVVWGEFLKWSGIVLGIAGAIALLGYIVFFKDIERAEQ